MREGASAIYIIASVAERSFTESSDIDFAVFGLKEERYISVYGELLEALHHEFDLIGLDYDDDFSRRIKETATFERVD